MVLESQLPHSSFELVMVKNKLTIFIVGELTFKTI